MIALISGTVAVRRGDHVVVDCHGVGYRLAVSSQTLAALPAVGGSATLHTHLITRDDGLFLYGFASDEERELFLLLLGVQSVGPKVAMDVLSGGPVRELFGALAAGDVARFQAVKGIGKRTAERIIVELREKVSAAASFEIDAIRVARLDDPRMMAREGLCELGYTVEEAESLLADAVGDTPEALIGAALRSARR